MKPRSLQGLWPGIFSPSPLFSSCAAILLWMRPLAVEYSQQYGLCLKIIQQYFFSSETTGIFVHLNVQHPLHTLNFPVCFDCMSKYFSIHISWWNIIPNAHLIFCFYSVYFWMIKLHIISLNLSIQTLNHRMQALHHWQYVIVSPVFRGSFSVYWNNPYYSHKIVLSGSFFKCIT